MPWSKRYAAAAAVAVTGFTDDASSSKAIGDLLCLELVVSWYGPNELLDLELSFECSESKLHSSDSRLSKSIPSREFAARNLGTPETPMLPICCSPESRRLSCGIDMTFSRTLYSTLTTAVLSSSASRLPHVLILFNTRSGLLEMRDLCWDCWVLPPIEFSGLDSRPS